MMEKNLYPEIPKEKFAFVQKDERIHDEKLQTKSISYLGDAWLRFRKNKSSVVAFCLIVFLLLFAIITPFVSPYTVQFRDGYYKSVLPKNTLFENAGFWDGARKEKVSEIGYHYYNAIGQETGVPVVKKEYDHYTDVNGVTYYNLRVDSYALVGFAYVNLSETEYNNLMTYQNENDIQVIYPLQKTHNSQYMMGNGGANFWYQLKDESVNTNGDPALDENGSLIPNYLTSDNPNKANYNSKRIAGDDGADGQWYTYAQKNQTGYRVRVHYLEYFRYINGYEPTFIFGTNNYGQDIFTCLAVGARLSFLLGNYITLTNLSEREIQRIVDLHISPVNISVHATDPELRVKLLQPKIVVCLGRIASQRMIRTDFSVTKEHGTFVQKNGVWFMGTFHPAALLRQPQNKPEAFADFTVLRDTIAAVCEHTYHK